MRRVVITGIGTVNALAQDVPGTFAAFRAGRCGIGALTFRDAERLSIRIGAEVRDWQPEARFAPGELPLYDRVTQYALVAGAEAVAMAALPKGLGLRGGVILGTAAGGIQTWEDSYRAVFAEGRNRVSPLVVPRLMHNAPASHLSIRHGLTGPVLRAPPGPAQKLRLSMKTRALPSVGSRSDQSRPNARAWWRRWSSMKVWIK